jgi:hypothetical protein
MEITNLNDAIIALRKARLAVAGGSSVIWNKLNNAVEYLESQVKTALAE